MDDVAVQLLRDAGATVRRWRGPAQGTCSGHPGSLECREVLVKLAIADDRLVIDQSLVDQHSCFFPGCRESACGPPALKLMFPKALGGLG